MLTGDFAPDFERAKLALEKKRKRTDAPGVYVPKPCLTCGGAVEHASYEVTTARTREICHRYICDACDAARPHDPPVGKWAYRRDYESGGFYISGFLPVGVADKPRPNQSYTVDNPPHMKTIDAQLELVTETHSPAREIALADAHEVAAPAALTLAVVAEQTAFLAGHRPASERGHAKISPSGMKNLEICPRYAPDPDREAHPVTLAGTRIHDALEAGSDKELADDEETRLAGMCRDYLAGLIETEGDRELEGESEVRLTVCDGVWGFADLFIGVRAEKRGHLIDWKTGFLAQEDVETNPAAQAYALGLFKLHPWLDSLQVHYVYPRIEIISTATFTRSQMPAFELRIKTIIARVEGEQPPFAEVDNCTFCGRKADCPALHALALPIARRYAEAKSELVVPDEYQPSQITDPAVMAKAMAVAQVLGDWVDSVKHHALAMRQDQGLELPGYDLRKRSGAKKILDPTVAERVALALGVSQQDFLGCISVSLKKLSDVVGEQAPPKGKKVAVTKLEDALRDAGVLDAGHETFFLQREAKNKKQKQLAEKT